MDSLSHFEVVGQRGIYRPAGEMDLRQLVANIEQAIEQAVERGLAELVVNALAVRGFEKPTTAERYFMTAAWAAASRGRVRFALVVGHEYIDPKKFGVLVASNRGMTCDVFPTEKEAHAWLDGQGEDRGEE